MNKTTIYVRWVNAFRNRRIYSVSEMLNYEYRRNDEACCEAIHYNNKNGYVSNIAQTTIGIIYNKSAVYRKFKADCWSEYINGKLVATQPARKFEDAGHNECFIRCDKKFIDGIIIEDSTKLESSVIEDIVKFSKENNVPIYELVKGDLIQRNIKTMIRNNHKFHAENSFVIAIFNRENGFSDEKDVFKQWVKKDDLTNHKNKIINHCLKLHPVDDEYKIEDDKIVFTNKWNKKYILKFIIK